MSPAIQGKERFLRVFANLPLNVRDEIVLVLPDRGPITWKVAYLEITNDTALGLVIMEKLIALSII
jgi:hypothetical protein